MAVIVGWIAESVREILQISGLTLQSFLVFCTAFILGCFLLKPRRNLPPYPAGRVPVLGHLLALGRAPHLKLTTWRRQYGDVFTVRMGMENVVVLNGYAAVKDALVDRSELFASRPQITLLMRSMVGFGKDIAYARWGTEFRQRKRFATAVMKNLGMKVGTGSIEEKIREEASFLRNRIAEYNGNPSDIAHDISVAVSNVICSMMMGERYDYRDETFRQLSEAVVRMAAEVTAGQIINVFPFLRFVPIVNRAGINVLQEASKIQNVIKEKMSRHRENPRDFLDFCLLEVEKQEKVEGLTEEIVVYMALDLFLAGIETTTNTLRWSLLYMTLNPDIQNKVLLNLYSLHMDPAYWPDPDRFDPGRFLDAEGNVVNKPESFMPFSGGRRVCLGEQLARMELFLFFSTLLQSFTFRTPEGAPPPTTDGVLGLTLTPHPFKLCAIPR
ncbi:PREDICTED: cytochrome P450 2U1-like [Branchiostoma belcheri]|uniref:Cytochrome P450 2U1-like n=1 Tax=Branchiostoma belcheri TaxID=7741 RepID=A0A6P4XZI9_BRABE|nr:PREDICTED: cytochrome P450 2U1-like [Branchiostoma belcheri]